MNNNNPKTPLNIAEVIVAKINLAEIKTKPKLFFMAKSGLVVAMVIFLFLFALYAVSLISFILRSNGILGAPNLGWWGVGLVLNSLPWLLILLAVLAIIILEITVGHFRFAYRRPALYSLLGVIILVIGGSVLAEQMEVHARLYRRAVDNRLPIFTPIYRDYDMMPIVGHHRGQVEKLEETGFWLRENKTAKKFEVVILPATRLMIPTGEEIEVGERVIVLGDTDGEVIEARAVLVPPDDLPDFSRPAMRRQMMEQRFEIKD
ncbi:MAG: hypothetical protein A2571_00950 [Candidatus Vogelbacteria bacterium RIFOXYD1_FULL_44_32]|uniref:Uncharacterized protein n=1 Tax=Candidatus Vogelbacteria bacterium RIFOXYD1_FULL_44_32 TaxID=1802438 RepID=A0A1G2QFU7_9BACT|nr:MAG: hypothetical protein A2571_00950 [Candidatus Vogelbacteria bacterium RIFOXYD1_FULL_44_32]